MLNYRLQQCMDLIVEGVDSGNVRLILQESAAFQSAFNELKGSIDDFVKLIGEVGLEGLKEPYAALAKAVDAAEQSLQDMPDEWEWKGQVDALKKPSGDSPPETMVSKIALDHDTNVNAVKDAVIEIAKYLEPYKVFFNVGSAGISMTDVFKKTIKTEPFFLALFSDEEYLFKLVGIEKGTDQNENEKKVKEAWKGMWDPQGSGEEKKWNDFVTEIEKLAGGIDELYNTCGKAIQNGKPSDELQGSVPEGGLIKNLLGALFGGDKGGTKIDPEKVMGVGAADPEGVLGLDFPKLNALVKGLLEMSGAASQASSGAVEAIDKNQQELAQDIPSTEVRDKLIKGYGEKPKDEQDLEGMKKTSMAMIAFQQILNKRDFTLDDISKIEGLKEKLTKVDNPYTKEEDIDELLEILELTKADDEEQEEVASPLDVLADIDEIPDEAKEEWLDTAEEQDLIDGEGDAKENNEPEAVKNVVGLLDQETNDEQQEELEGALMSKSEEEEMKETFVRWGELAGIIKG